MERRTDRKKERICRGQLDDLDGNYNKCYKLIVPHFYRIRL